MKFDFFNLLKLYKHHKIIRYVIPILFVMALSVVSYSFYVSAQSGSGAVLGPSLQRGLVGHWTMDEESYMEGTENLLYDNGVINWTVGNLTASISRSVVISNQRYKLRSGANGGAFRFYIPLTKLVNGETYTLSYKYKINSGTQFYMSDWCDRVLLNKVDIGNGTDDSYSFASGSRSVYDTTYNFMDFVISGNSEVEIWDVQLEKSTKPSSFVVGIRQGAFLDTTPYSNMGNKYGTTLTNDRLGQSGGAVSFDGVDDYINFSNHNKFNVSNNFSISLWIKRLVDSGNYEGIVAKKMGDDTGYHLTINSNDKLRFPQYSSGAISNNVIPLNTWVYVVAIQDGGINKLYIDGALQSTTGSYSVGLNNEPLVLGRLYSSAGSWFFPGVIDDFRFYGRVLSEEEINLLYNSYKPKIMIKLDSPKITSNLQKGLVLDVPLTSTYTQGGTTGSEIMTNRTPYSSIVQNNGANLTNSGSIFDGVDDYIRLPSEIVSTAAIRSNGVTYAAWVKSVNTDSLQRIVGQKPGSGYSDFASGGLGIGVNKASMIAYDDTGAYKYATGNKVLQNDTWYYIVGTYNSIDKNIRVYVNGEIDGSPVLINTFSRLVVNGDNTIGRQTHTSAAYHFNGQISNTRIYNRALSPEEISLLYSRGRN